MITVQNCQKRLSLKPVSVENTVRRILKICRVDQAELTFVFVTRQKIAALNLQFLGRSYATDVLSFDLRESPRQKLLRGDIIISTDAVVAQAQQFGQPVQTELTLYMIHGILHLLGYDDHSPKDIARMRAEEKRILSILEK